ncbi:MAG: TIGR03067 domain-containing protein [Pseudomonadota bacterium]
MSPPLEGRWQPLRAEFAGVSAPAEVLAKTELELRAGHYTVRFGAEAVDHGSYAHDRCTNGALILTGLKGTNAGRTLPAIYQLVGDRLRICYGIDGQSPDAFAATPGSQRYLVTYRRKTS